MMARSVGHVFNKDRDSSDFATHIPVLVFQMEHRDDRAKVYIVENILATRYQD